MAYRIVFLSSIHVRTTDRRGRLKRLNERPNNQAPLTPASSGTQSADPASQNVEINSLYAIHNVQVEVGRWWSDGVQNSVFLCLQYRYEEAIVLSDLSD